MLMFANPAAHAWSQQFNGYRSLALRQLEELTELQLRIARSCADLGALQLRGAAAVRDWNSLQTFLLNQRMVRARFGERLANDARAALTLGTASAH
jgi:phasin family protein